MKVSTKYWICPTCDKGNPEVSGICPKCMGIRPSDVEIFVKEEDFDSTYKSGRPDFLRRQLSWKIRITRTDFIISILGSFLFTIFFVFKGNEYEDSYGIASWIFLAYILLSASKRCRDADINPWLSIPLTIFIPGLLVLFMARGTEGPNRYGPNPRKRYYNQAGVGITSPPPASRNPTL